MRTNKATEKLLYGQDKVRQQMTNQIYFER